MRYVHSLWTKPMLENMREVKFLKQGITFLWCHASSVAYLKSMNLPIVLYADQFAQELLDFLPYDQILELRVPASTPTILWAAGKFFAYQQMQLKDVHIDGDVFIKNLGLHKAIEDGIENNDLIFQSVEDINHTANGFYESVQRMASLYHIEFINDANNDHTPAINCGLVGMNNKELKKAYVENYMNCLQQMADNREAQEWTKQASPCWPDLLFEQKNLWDIAIGSGKYSTYNLLGTHKEAYRNAYKLGYQHVLGDAKWLQLDLIKEQLRQLNPYIYHDTEMQVNKFLDRYDL